MVWNPSRNDPQYIITHNHLLRFTGSALVLEKFNVFGEYNSFANPDPYIKNPYQKVTYKTWPDPDSDKVLVIATDSYKIMGN